MTTNSSGPNVLTADKLVSDPVAYHFKIISTVFLCGCISVIGMAANVINIVVFIRQGVFTDNSCASLLCLAVSDLFSLSSMVWYSASFYITLTNQPGLSFDAWDVHYITGAWPHIMLAHFTRMVTAYVALERCICVVFPFKVKVIFTPRRSFTVITIVFVCCGMAYSPVFIVENLKWITQPHTNTTRLVLVSASNWELTVDVMYYVNSVIFNLASVAIVFVCTMVTVSRVNLSKAWRTTMATGSSSSKPEVLQDPGTTVSESPRETNVGVQNVSKQDGGKGTAGQNKMSKSRIQKERNLVRMITFISVAFLISYLPDLTYLVASSIVPDIRILGKYENLAMILYSLANLMETVNSSINIVIYYKMSSRFKQEFRLLFGMK